MFLEYFQCISYWAQKLILNQKTPTCITFLCVWKSLESGLSSVKKNYLCVTEVAGIISGAIKIWHWLASFSQKKSASGNSAWLNWMWTGLAPEPQLCVCLLSLYSLLVKPEYSSSNT